MSDLEPLVRIWAGTAIVHALIQKGEAEAGHGSPKVTILPACSGLTPRAHSAYRVSDASLMPASVALAKLRQRRDEPRRGRVCERCLAALEAAVCSPGSSDPS